MQRPPRTTSVLIRVLLFRRRKIYVRRELIAQTRERKTLRKNRRRAITSLLFRRTSLALTNWPPGEVQRTEREAPPVCGGFVALAPSFAAARFASLARSINLAPRRLCHAAPIGRRRRRRRESQLSVLIVARRPDLPRRDSVAPHCKGGASLAATRLSGASKCQNRVNLSGAACDVSV